MHHNCPRVAPAVANPFATSPVATGIKSITTATRRRNRHRSYPPLRGYTGDPTVAGHIELEQDKRGPGLRFPPPLLPLALIAGGWGLNDLSPLALGSLPWLVWAGILLLVIAGLIALLTLLQFLRARTHIEPWHPTTTVIRDGLFRYSRNPIYLSFCIATAGAGLWLNNAWILLGLPLLVVLLWRLVIAREEAYLERKFGEPYREYCRQVRRWL